VHIVKTDLKPGIRAGILSPVQFAVLVPHAVSTASSGTWSTSGGKATWQYAVEVPTAVSISFHATRSSLPSSAVLVVRGAKTTVSYRAHDLHRGELWSRIQPGEAVELTLTVAAAERNKVALNIVSLQAGYRALGPGVEDHAYYRQLRAQLNAATGTASCVTNYECQVNAANTPQGAATIALVINNQYQCSGSLINDVPADNTPYVLTARHCESGQLGGGDPGAASGVTVYWDATSSCGSTLGSIYDPNIPTQTGAQTIVEQQDAWLIRLDVSPVVSDAQFAGFDASGTAVQGGYTIHHAEGYDKQFVGWYGQVYVWQRSGVLGTGYLSNFLETVNQLGNIGPGASGSGLFDQNNHLVGSLSLGRTTTDPSGYGACPVTPLAAPDGSNGVADFTALSAVWSSTADTTSSTGSATLKSVLDPANTGTLVVRTISSETIIFSVSPENPSLGQPAVLTWSAPYAVQCTASGGVTGDGWTGTLAASGSRSVTETGAGGYISYTLSCTYPVGRASTAQASIVWIGPTPEAQLEGPSAVWTTRPAKLSWGSNVPPCSLAGGALSLSDLPSNGSTTTTQATASDVTYSLTCGPAGNQASSALTVSYVTPSVVLEPNGTDRILGQYFGLEWSTLADVCIPSGGAPDDGWANNAFNGPTTPVAAFSPQVTTAGKYTYTLTCSSGPISLRQRATVTFEQNAPYATAALASSSVTYTGTPADYVGFNWDSNLSTCIVGSTPDIPYSYSDPLMISYQAQGSVTLNPPAPGTYAISVNCASSDSSAAVTSAPQTLTVLRPAPPTETLSITPSTVIEGQQFKISWSSANSTYCGGSGGIAGIGWDTNGAFSDPPAGTFSYAPGGPGQVGQFTFIITCESIAPSGVAPTSAQAQLTVVSLTDTLSANPPSVTTGNTFTLTWSSTGATGCSAGGGGADGSPWTGTLATSGTATQTASVVGMYGYTLTCNADGYTTQAQASVNVSAPSTGGGSSGGGGGGGGGHGGGALGVLDLGSLAALLGLVRCAGLRMRPVASRELQPLKKTREQRDRLYSSNMCAVLWPKAPT
jgi:hypothetical protein